MLEDNPAVFLGYGSLQSLRLSKQDYQSSRSGGEVTGAVCPWLCGRLFPRQTPALLSSLPRRGPRVSGRAVGTEGLLLAGSCCSRSGLCRAPRGRELDPRCKALQLFWKDASPRPQLQVGWRQPSHAAATGIAPKPGLGRGTLRGRTRGSSSSWADWSAPGKT